MATYYLDIETTGLNPFIDEIITIQYQELNRNTGKPIGKLIILKEWELGEKGMLQKFIEDSKILDPCAFSFVAVGFNLTFERNFLQERTSQHGLPELDILQKPFIDLRAIAVIMNQGEFKGSSLDAMTGKKSNGMKIPEYYVAKEYQKIIDYIINETEEFIKFNSWLYAEMPELHKKFREQVLLKSEAKIQ